MYRENTICGSIHPVYPIISHLYPYIKKLRINVNHRGLEPAMYRPYFPIYPRNIKKLQKNAKKDLTSP
tara:strand:- start:42 stop:245 length:204 start_codon:yes stop_codon:yes gene_type:complete